MKSLIVPLLATASFSTFLICGMVAASSLHLGYTPHKFANINASIWTSTPKRVVPSEQGLTREPAAELAAQDAQAVQGDRLVATASDRMPTADGSNANTQQVASEDVSACQARYKSYRASDNSYQPFDGGPRRQCGLSAQTLDGGMAANAVATPTIAQNVDQNHAGWCQARYSSYRASDDTYQPFNSTDRRRCMSPVVSLASNG